MSCLGYLISFKGVLKIYQEVKIYSLEKIKFARFMPNFEYAGKG